MGNRSRLQLVDLVRQDECVTTGNFKSADILADEARTTLKQLSNDDAIDLGLLALKHARERHLTIALEVHRSGVVLLRAALPGSTPDNDRWLASKARIVENFHHSTLYERVRHEENDVDFYAATGLSPEFFAAHGGGVPLATKGTGVIGALIVSGLPQVEDHNFAIDVLSRYIVGERA
jgi:uncharacterized protein (UPF0303 family)